MSEEELKGVSSDISTFNDDDGLWADFDAVAQISDFVEKSNSPTYNITLDGPQELMLQPGAWKKTTGSTIAIRSTSRFGRRFPGGTHKETCDDGTAMSADSSSIGVSYSLSNHTPPNLVLPPSRRAVSITSYLRHATLTSGDKHDSLTPDLGPSSTASATISADQPKDKQRSRPFYSDTKLSSSKASVQKVHKVPSLIKLTKDPTGREMKRVTSLSSENTAACSAALTHNDSKPEDTARASSPEGPDKVVSIAREEDKVVPVIRKKKKVVKQTRARQIVVKPAADAIDSDSDVSDNDVTFNDDHKLDTNQNLRRRSRKARRRHRKLKAVRLKLTKIVSCFHMCCKP